MEPNKAFNHTLTKQSEITFWLANHGNYVLDITNYFILIFGNKSSALFMCTMTSCSFTLTAKNNPEPLHLPVNVKIPASVCPEDNGGNVRDVKCQDMLRKGTVEDIFRHFVFEPITAQRTSIGQDTPFPIFWNGRRNKNGWLQIVAFILTCS
ncbi:hypothetical protein CEXT_573541 [Caerostris extrusa]|uniref:Uncharacterized protein n=1 Tax=Caerostris extrusa TaxID=172846 RepID=A0AAV4S9T3_CAEEX|nr:hypothetical protein CEXT_573541 [Caerostris extrusa]